jgi:hypothetical protein
VREWTAELGTRGFLISSFGRDQSGELYILQYDRGGIHRIAPAGR